ncbi:hypothetical protein F5888DRAFT_1624165, partial [Russula emetica]
GHDSTVHSSSTPEEIALARAIVPELKDVESFLVLTIPDDSDRPSERRYIISSPEPRPDIPIGRWTRSLFALDVKEKCRVLVKDSWRVLLKDIKPEGELYDLLHRGKVDNIPSCLLAGDVGADIYHQTQTHKVGNDMNYKLTPHRHYRIVLGTIGRKLEEFKCTREFVNAMYAALKAHKAAHDIGILHRDISPGNILIACDDELDHNDPHESHQEKPPEHIWRYILKYGKICQICWFVKFVKFGRSNFKFPQIWLKFLNFRQIFQKFPNV